MLCQIISFKQVTILPNLSVMGEWLVCSAGDGGIEDVVSVPTPVTKSNGMMVQLT